jgi:hypothetical protein
MRHPSRYALSPSAMGPDAAPISARSSRPVGCHPAGHAFNERSRIAGFAAYGALISVCTAEGRRLIAVIFPHDQAPHGYSGVSSPPDEPVDCAHAMGPPRAVARGAERLTNRVLGGRLKSCSRGARRRREITTRRGVTRAAQYRSITSGDGDTVRVFQPRRTIRVRAIYGEHRRWRTLGAVDEGAHRLCW